jgi:TatD DNase family protein
VTYVDTHCHLDHHGTLSVAEQVDRARAAEVHTMITVGTDVASSEQAVATAARFDGVHAAVGIHPNDADTATPDALAAIEALAAAPEVVAIGETGLDRYRDHTTPEQQEPAFRVQIALAARTGKTLVVHCRDAWPECLAVLADAEPPARVVMHCFSGDLEVVRRCAEAGWYLSFAGNVTFRNAGDLRAAAAAAPAELLLTETDSPYLTPDPFRGRPNDPSHIPYTLRALAAGRGEDPAALAAQVLGNARRAFGLP